MRELDRLKVIQDVVDGRLKPWRAAERLGLMTDRTPWISSVRRYTSSLTAMYMVGYIASMDCCL
ncbi:hypothetical protein ACLKMY_39425 [Paraburkholderia mimosarum]|uniref:hypothetical protein n=1 Tax=Paraburkholderia mimosarum TaxID=312026 RepID=UPI001427A2B2|nr:hypothetical protein [Paraburkholderia mimosarum]